MFRKILKCCACSVKCQCFILLIHIDCWRSINHERFQQMEAVMESNELGDVGEFLIANGYAAENKLNWRAATANDAPLFYPG